jgi:hypothetical protein
MKELRSWKTLSAFAILLAGLLNSGISFSQDLCSSTNSDKIYGGFEFDGYNSGCGPFTVKLIDESGGSNVKYVYNYQGQDASALATLNPTDELENTYSSMLGENTSNFTILQYGKRPGPDSTDFYSCENVAVFKSNEPYFTTSACNNNFLQISIPDSSINDFDYYELDWNDGSAMETITKNEIPFLKSKNYSSNVPFRTILLEGKYLNPVSGCSTVLAKLVEMKSGSDYPNIDLLEVLDDSRIQMTFSGNSGQVYDVYQRKISESYIFGNETYKLKPGTHILNIDNDSQYCFALFRNFGCMETSGEVCSVLLDSITPVGYDNLIEWVPHPDNNRAYFGQGIADSQTKNTIQELLIANDSNINHQPVSGSKYSDNGIDCKQKNCYQIVATVTGTARGSDLIPFSGISKSRTFCDDRSQITPPSINELMVSVENEIPVISFIDDSNWPLQKDIYFLSSAGEILDSIDVTEMFRPSMATNEKSQCFQVSYRDDCGSNSELSPIVCSIFLSTNGSDEISWEEVSPYAPSDISSHSVLLFDENTNLSSVIYSEASFENNSLKPDLESFVNNAKFQIKTINPKGLESFSNIVNIPIKTKLFLPSAVNRDNNSDGSFKIFGSLSAIREFNISIYNRWGNIVFQSEDADFEWAAKNQPTGSYTYYIYAESISNEILKKTGNVFIF